MQNFGYARFVTSLYVVLLVGATISATAEQRTPYTEAELENAIPMGIPGVRTWADAPLNIAARAFNTLVKSSFYDTILTRISTLKTRDTVLTWPTFLIVSRPKASV
jgi:hypothetical protein